MCKTQIWVVLKNDYTTRYTIPVESDLAQFRLIMPTNCNVCPVSGYTGVVFPDAERPSKEFKGTTGLFKRFSPV